jgi:hypothetical protein
LLVFEALGIEPPPWTEPLPAAELDLFDRARNGWASIGDLLATGLDVDVVDRCGATPLWYAVRALDHRAAPVSTSTRRRSLARDRSKRRRDGSCPPPSRRCSTSAPRPRGH